MHHGCPSYYCFNSYVSTTVNLLINSTFGTLVFLLRFGANFTKFHLNSWPLGCSIEDLQLDFSREIVILSAVWITFLWKIVKSCKKFTTTNVIHIHMFTFFSVIFVYIVEIRSVFCYDVTYLLPFQNIVYIQD